VADQILHTGRQRLTKLIEQRPAIVFREAQHAGAGINQAACALMRVAKEALSERQRVHRPGQALDERVPPVGLAGLNSVQVTLHKALIPERP